MSSNLQPFNFEKLRDVLKTHVPNPEILNCSVDGIKSKLNGSTNPTRRELIRALFSINRFPNTSTIPHQIANSFDLMIRRDVPSFTLAKLKEKLNKNTIECDLISYVKSNDELNKFFYDCDDTVIKMFLLNYINVVLRTIDLEHNNLIRNFDASSIFCSMSQELDSELGIFSGVINQDHRDFIKNLFKLFLVDFLKIWETKSLQPLSSVQDSTDIAQKSYLDLCSGALNIKYLDQLLSADHSRQFLFLDKSQAIKLFYDTVNELTAQEFEKRVRLVNQDIFSDWSHSIPAGSVGTIRASNIFSFIFKNNTDGETYTRMNILFSHINRALAPGGKFIMCLRHNSRSISQDISIDEIFYPNRDYGLMMHEGFDSINEELSLQHLLLFIIAGIAIKAGYTFKVGHTDSSGNFIEGKTASNEDSSPNADTELIMIKPKS